MSIGVDDNHQDIARSSYADMLHDHERNLAYRESIKICVTYLVKSEYFNPKGDRFFNCCDIGTGSGLLSLMIAREFRELSYEKFHVIAFECFEPMANCASRIIEKNGFSSDITVVPRRSDQWDNKENIRFDMLVAELLDTELIGEGCLQVYRHAIENLTHDNTIYIPFRAKLCAEPVFSKMLTNRHYTLPDDTVDIDNTKLRLIVSPEVRDCSGSTALDDMHFDALEPGLDFLSPMQGPKRVFEFIFDDISSLKLKDRVKLEYTFESDAQGIPSIVMWWDAIMYDWTLIENLCEPRDSVVMDTISCAPRWRRYIDDNDGRQVRRDEKVDWDYIRGGWREHWLQAVYYLPSLRTPSIYKSGETLTIYASHDSHSLWFDTKLSESPQNCVCGVHRKLSRPQNAFLNDLQNVGKLVKSSIGDPVDLSVAEVTFFDANYNKSTLSKPFPSSNANWSIQLNEKTIMDPGLGGDIPWTESLKRISSGLRIEPFEKLSIKFAACLIDNLFRTRLSIKKCEGFDMSYLDEMIRNSSKLVDNPVESHYLWEYKVLLHGSKVETIYEYPNKEDDQSVNGSITKEFILDAAPDRNDIEAWALAFWAEYQTKSGEIISTGPTVIRDSSEGYLTMSSSFKQLVYFLNECPLPEGDGDKIVKVSININELGELSVKPQTS